MSVTDAPLRPVSSILGQAAVFLLLIVAVAALYWQFNVQQTRQWSQLPRQTVALEGEYYALNSRQLDGLAHFSTAHFAAGAERGREQVEVQIRAQVAASFAQVHERLPAFADWYYSLSGEYSRLAMAALSRTQLVEGDFVVRRMAGLLFPEPTWQAGMQQLEQDADSLLLAQRAATRASWLAQLAGMLAGQQLPPALAAAQNAVAPAIPLDELLERLGALDVDVMLERRIVLSSVAATGMAGRALWQVAVARNAAASARVVAAGGTRAGSRLGGAATGALICAPSGPLALACAAGVLAATWVATDWLLLQVDEKLNRQQLLSRMEVGLNDLQAGLEGELLAAYEQRIAALQQVSAQQISATFSLRTAK